jgi:23S rRNA pseudouridine1911/1915/1917 synthase
MNPSYEHIKHIKNLKPHLLSELLIQDLSLTTDEVKLLFKFGAIYVNNERQLKDKFISENNLIRVHTKPRRYFCDYPWSSFIIFENDFFLILNKPSGIPSHPVIDNVLENALTQTSLARRYPLFVTHRLDRLTSGLIVYAKKPSFVKSFNFQMQDRSIRKKYVALVETSQLLPQKLTHFMSSSKVTPKKLTDTPAEGSFTCQLEIIEQKVLSPKHSWIKINLLTGRTHQIRAQLSFLNAAILGDELYGSKISFTKEAIALRSCEIEFNFGSERMKFNLNEEWN